MSTTHLYFIAVIPGGELQERIKEIRQDFARRFNSRRALKVIPHITLKAPFIIPAELHPGLLQWFGDFTPEQKTFITSLNSFGAFPNKGKPVVFIRPVNHAELSMLQQHLINSFKEFAPFLLQPVDKKFTPHVTVAYRDLSPDNFQLAWSEYKDKAFEGVFEVNEVHLLQHTGGQWHVIATRELMPV